MEVCLWRKKMWWNNMLPTNTFRRVIGGQKSGKPSSPLSPGFAWPFQSTGRFRQHYWPTTRASFTLGSTRKVRRSSTSLTGSSSLRSFWLPLLWLFPRSITITGSNNILVRNGNMMKIGWMFVSAVCTQRFGQATFRQHVKHYTVDPEQNLDVNEIHKLYED